MIAHSVESTQIDPRPADAALAPGGPPHLLPGARARLCGGDAEPRPRARIGAALPDDPLALRTPVRLGWPAGTFCVRDLAWTPPTSLPPTATIRDLSERMCQSGVGWVAIAGGSNLIGAVSAEAVLAAIAHGKPEATARELLSTQVPICGPAVRVVDAVRTMFDAHLRQLPILEDGRFVGLLPLSTAAAAAERDPAVGDVLESEATRPARFARSWW